MTPTGSPPARWQVWGGESRAFGTTGTKLGSSWASAKGTMGARGSHNVPVPGTVCSCSGVGRGCAGAGAQSPPHPSGVVMGRGAAPQSRQSPAAA